VGDGPRAVANRREISAVIAMLPLMSSAAFDVDQPILSANALSWIFLSLRMSEIVSPGGDAHSGEKPSRVLMIVLDSHDFYSPNSFPIDIADIVNRNDVVIDPKNEPESI
jgi:hypothetical protein